MKIYNIVLDEPKPFMEINRFAKGIDPNVLILTLEDGDDRTYRCYNEKVATSIKENFGAEVSVIDFNIKSLIK